MNATITMAQWFSSVRGGGVGFDPGPFDASLGDPNDPATITDTPVPGSHHVVMPSRFTSAELGAQAADRAASRALAAQRAARAAQLGASRELTPEPTFADPPDSSTTMIVKTPLVWIGAGVLAVILIGKVL